MKMKIGLLLASIMLLLSACASNDSTKLKKLESEISALKQENEQLKGEQASLSTAAKDSDSLAVSEDVKEVKQEDLTPQVITLMKGQPYSIEDFAEVIVSKTQFSKKIEPSSPGSYYTYYESKEADSTYLAITLKIKNLADSGKTADTLADIKFKYDGKYEYTTFTILEEGSGEDFTYANISSIQPLKTGTLLYLAEVPKEIETDEKPLSAEIKINGEAYEYKIR
ncbi:hypothetical protein J2T13_003617 [Paenibacillus sp. DS2015]|uniref:bZIP transcription factor n=1 Tax=Paenibacillus sp. DS2015 TaxID=3373917 RepID=UPI003D1EC9B9